MLVLAAVAPVVQAQITSQNSDMHTIISARAAALGDSYVSDAHDVSVMYWNPAGLSFLQRQSVVVNYALEEIEPNGDVMTENLAVPLPQIGVVNGGIGITVHHIGKLDDASPIAGSDFMVLGADVGLAATVARGFSLGGTFTARNGRLKSLSAWAFNSTVGAYYEPDPGISYGIAFQGAGDAIVFPYEAVSRPTSVGTVTPLHSLQIGLTMRYPWQPEQEPYLILTLANQKIFNESKLIYKGGIEWYAAGILALRIGYWIGPQTVAGKYGAGIRLSRLQVDYAISPSKFEPRFHQLSVAVTY